MRWSALFLCLFASQFCCAEQADEQRREACCRYVRARKSAMLMVRNWKRQGISDSVLAFPARAGKCSIALHEGPAQLWCGIWQPTDGADDILKWAV